MIARRPTNLSLDAELVAEARRLGVNVSRACEEGLQARVAAEQALRWQEENGDAMRAANAYIDAHGLPLAAQRLF